MKSNTHNQRSNISFFYPSVTPSPTHLFIQQNTSLRNPTTEDFERLIQQYQQ